MNRRAFLELIASGLIASTVDVDRLLWIPNQKTIFIPSADPLLYDDLNWLLREFYLPKIKMMFEREDGFYSKIVQKPMLGYEKTSDS